MPATRPQQARLPRLRCRAEVLVPGACADLLNPGAYPGEVAALATPERTLIALGVAWRASWDAPPAAGALAELCSAWLERLPEPGDEALAQLPWIWGGRGFFARPLTGPWRGWPSAELRIPRHVLAAEAGSERVTLLSFVDEEAPRPRALPGRSQHAAQTEALPSRDAWIAHAERARQAVIDGGAEPGGLAKLVPVRATRFCLPSGARYDAGCLWEALGGAPGVRYLWRHHQQAFVGRTPERLLAVEGARLRADALAGTAPRGATSAEDAALGAALLASPKIRDEHAAVVRGIRARLSELGLELEVPGPRLRRLAEAQHVETPLAGPRGGHGLWSLVERLHPTPALGGEPQGPAQRWLEDHEPVERGWFGAPLGWVDRAGDGEAWVAIRGALLDGPTAWAYAGAGVVAGSDPAAEWDETELKLTAVTNALEAARVEDS